ncbi:outer membrane beta-barrel protein [Fibrella aquatilis]|uniref:Outer membrane beta-barrel protein n=1 Tax=Fibrella aquatilis TaxID=2817059 RepID=A0A939G418_9BACT|nr:outer membrane beta-barrel protein [Fibrella aquatilis]MBO0929418.1 outer membrane beta-barrel protein [Fibrella aquatilis]
MNKVYLLSLCLLSILTRPTLAQNTLSVRSDTEGLQLTAFGGLSNWSSDYFSNLDEAEPLGWGGGLQAGYGFTQRISVYLRYEGYSFKQKLEWDTYRMRNFGLGVRWHFSGTTQPLRPYLEAGYSSMSLLIEPVYFNGQLYPYSLTGGAFTGGAGLQGFITPRFSLSLGLTGAFGSFGTFQINNQSTNEKPDVTQIKVGLGLNYFISLD